MLFDSTTAHTVSMATIRSDVDNIANTCNIITAIIIIHASECSMLQASSMHTCAQPTLLQLATRVQHQAPATDSNGVCCNHTLQCCSISLCIRAGPAYASQSSLYTATVNVTSAGAVLQHASSYNVCIVITCPVCCATDTRIHTTACNRLFAHRAVDGGRLEPDTTSHDAHAPAASAIAVICIVSSGWCGCCKASHNYVWHRHRQAQLPKFPHRHMLHCRSVWLCVCRTHQRYRIPPSTLSTYSMALPAYTALAAIW